MEDMQRRSSSSSLGFLMLLLPFALILRRGRSDGLFLRLLVRRRYRVIIGAAVRGRRGLLLLIVFEGTLYKIRQPSGMETGYLEAHSVPIHVYFPFLATMLCRFSQSVAALFLNCFLNSLTAKAVEKGP